RAFALSGDQEFAREYREVSDAILPAIAALIEAVKATPTEQQLIEETKPLVERQIAIKGELIRLRNAGDSAAIAALVGQEDRAATTAITGNLEKAVAEERRLLFARCAAGRAPENRTNVFVPAGVRSRGGGLVAVAPPVAAGVDPPLAPGTAGF